MRRPTDFDGESRKVFDRLWAYVEGGGGLSTAITQAVAETGRMRITRDDGAPMSDMEEVCAATIVLTSLLCAFPALVSVAVALGKARP